MVPSSSIDLVDITIDEVALEGLDGITIEALWQRLAQRLNNLLPFSEAFTTQIWSICVRVREFRFYDLQVPRESLIIFDRYEFVDPDLGIILEPENVPTDIYPHCPIHDSANDIKGSCSTYYGRKEITDIVRNLSLDDAKAKYGQKLVIVASQFARERAIMGIEVCPILELNVTQYCFLERVGRSRYHGEVTQGKLSLSALKEDPRSLFYHRKFLLRYKLITKQIHHQKSSGHSCNGSLLHLPRFFVERKPKVIFLAEQVIEILKTKSNYVAEYDEIKRKLQIENSIKKLFKTSFFQKVVRTDLRVPYRTLYPNAKPTEWHQKNNPAKEKMIKVVQLLVPNIDITEMWNKDEIQEEDDPQELNISNHKYNVPYLKQANFIIERCASDGVCQGSLAREMGLTKLQSRTLLRNMVKAKIVATYMNDMGRQRLTKFVSKKFEKSSKMSKQFKKEMCKIKELTRHIATNGDDIDKTKILIEQKTHDDYTAGQEENQGNLCKFEAIDKNSSNNRTTGTNEESIRTAAELRKTFYVVNRILYKYRLTKHTSRYKCTFLGFSTKFLDKETLGERKKYDCRVLSFSSDLSNNQKATSLYRNIKADLTALKPSITEKPVNEIFGFMKDVQNSEKKKISNITYRLLRRANMIIESVKQHQVIDDMTKLLKMIHEEEDREGYDVKIDKKSLVRLLQKLAKDNLVRIIKLTLSGNGKEKNLTFICDLNIDINHSVIQSSVEQAKLKFCLVESQKVRSPVNKNADKLNVSGGTLHVTNNTNKSEGQSSKLSLPPPSTCKYDPKIAKRYGYSPKFLRMQALHIFLYYLVYNHPGEQTLSKEEQIKSLRNNGFPLEDELAEEFNTIFTTDVSWKMFVPPLPKYSGWPTGWTLMCDVLLRLPLSIFLKIHSIPFVVPDLHKYLTHPIKKHYLVKDLPVDIRNYLLYGRKYIFNIHLTATRLCYIGLIQFGPQRLKEKDQVFIYVNRQTELLDTTSSSPSYHIIEEKSYPVVKYKFDEIPVVEKYWYDMWNVCINTPLGGRLVVQGKDILLEELSKKTEMIKAITARSRDEAVCLDTGEVPGDRKGAAGIDSAFFAHLKRNWNWSIANSNVTYRPEKRSRGGNIVYERDAYLSKIKAKPLKFTEFSGLKKVSGPHLVNAAELRRKKHQQQCSNNIDTNQEKRYEALTSHRSTKQKSFVRRVLPRKLKTRRRTKYDEIDYRALQRMHKLRVDWEPQEDKILLVCKVVMMYLCPNPRKQIVTFTAVRDVLRSYSFISHNKTSRACQRRLLYMLRQQQTVNSVALGVEEIKQNFFIRKRFGGIADKLKEEYRNSHECEKKMTEAFKTLVAYVAKKYYDISEIGPKEPLPIPKTAQEFNIFCKTVHPAKPFSNRGFVKDVRTVNDIHSATINSVIHSSMCCGKDRRSWAYQLFKVYQQYPEILLRNAMMRIRADQMVTVKKNHMCPIRKYGNYMPMSSSQYQLSSNYIYKFQTKWPYDIFKETYHVFFKLLEWYSENQTKKQSNVLENFNGTEVLPVTGGTVGAICDYFVQGQVDFDIEIPEQIIMLDPRLKEKDETYFRIAQRYQDVLASLDHLKLSQESPFEEGVKTSTCICHNDLDFKNGSNTGRNDIKNSDNTQATNIDTKLCKGSNRLFDLHKHEVASAKERNIVERNVENTKSVTYYDDLNVDSCKQHFHGAANGDVCVTKLQDGTKIVSNKDHTKDLTSPESENWTLQKTVSEQHSLQRKEHTIRDEDDGKLNASTSKLLSPELSNIKGTNSDFSTANITAHKRSKDVCKEVFDFSDGPRRKKRKLCNKGVNILDINEETSNINMLNTTPIDSDDNEISADKSNKSKPNHTEQIWKIDDTAEIEPENVLESRGKNEKIFTRVSDILKNLDSKKSYLKSYCKIDDRTDIQKRSTRIAMLRMREELSELTVADSHHAHEYFVVNMFKILYSLPACMSEYSDKIESFKGLTIPSELLPLKINTANDLIREINKFAVFPKDDLSYSDLRKSLSVNASIDIDEMDTIYTYVRNRREIGASIQELMDKFKHTMGRNLWRILTVLTENYLLLRSGVTTVRYIHHRYVNAWLIHSFKIHRLEKESLLPVPRGSVYVTEPNFLNHDVNIHSVVKENKVQSTSSKKNPSRSIFEEPITANNQTQLDLGINENKASDQGQSSNIDEVHTGHVKKRLHRKRTRLLPQRDISKAAKQLDFKTAEEIRVVIKPWIRIDGVLNRRVLDRMLGAVLSYCLTHPGMTLTKVQSRFVPALQPFHTLELIEMLIKLKCLERKALRKRRITLFSKPSVITENIADNYWAAEEDIYLEPAIGAMMKFGIFLSSKLYNSDFIP